MRDNQPCPPDCARADYLQHGLQSGLYGIPTLYGLVQPFNSARAQRSFVLTTLSTTASGCRLMVPHSLATALRAVAPLVLATLPLGSGRCCRPISLLPFAIVPLSVPPLSNVAPSLRTPSGLKPLGESGSPQRGFLVYRLPPSPSCPQVPTLQRVGIGVVSPYLCVPRAFAPSVLWHGGRKGTRSRLLVCSFVAYSQTRSRCPLAKAPLRGGTWAHGDDGSALPEA